MAISIPTNLSGQKRLSDDLRYYFSMSDIGDGVTTKKTFNYRIKESGGTVLTGDYEHEPKVGVSFPIDVENAARKALGTGLIKFLTQGGNTIAERKKGLLVEYWERTYDLENCTDPVDGTPASSSTVEVYNSTVQWYESSTIGAAMYSKPLFDIVSHFSSDFMYARSGTIAVNIIFRDGSNVNNNITAVSDSFEAYTGVGQKYFGGSIPSNIDRVEITHDGVTYVRKVCYNEEMVNVYFTEHQGGYGMMSFEQVTQGLTVRSSERSFNVDGKDQPETEAMRLTYGLITINKDGNARFTLQKLVPPNQENYFYCQDFLNSKKHIIEFLYNGNPVRAKFDLNDGDVDIATIEGSTLFTISGTISTDFKLPN